jgi:hypothetical protein
MPMQAKTEIEVLASESMSTAAAAAQLNAETRAFGNASAKLNLQLATAAFLEAKRALLAKAPQPTEATTKAE